MWVKNTAWKKIDVMKKSDGRIFGELRSIVSGLSRNPHHGVQMRRGLTGCKKIKFGKTHRKKFEYRVVYIVFHDLRKVIILYAGIRNDSTYDRLWADEKALRRGDDCDPAGDLCPGGDPPPRGGPHAE